MKYLRLFFLLLLISSCNETSKKNLTAQEIVDKSIEIAGGKLYERSTISFKFRDKNYISESKGKTLKRIFNSDSLRYIDIKTNDSFQRYVDDVLVEISDSLATVYGNSINSVFYFAQLPYRLNDAAVNKELLNEVKIKGKDYFVIQVTFDPENGGDDFGDTYLYWMNKETFMPDYLAYDFHTDGGGVRFREAYNERYVNGIRFVDYKNYNPENSKVTVIQTANLFENNQLELLSDIQLENVKVTLD
jgi:hypothetical protein